MGIFVEVEPNVKVYVEDLNKTGKVTMVFIHGWPLNHNQFEYQYNVLPQHGIRCIGYDWRGYGQSDRPYEGYTFDRMADDLRAIIDQLELMNVILVGHSTGGAIAARYMSRHQGYGVSGIVFLSAALPVGLPETVVNEKNQLTLQDRPLMIHQLTDQFFFRYATGSLQQWFFLLCLQAASWSTIAVMNMLNNADLHKDVLTIEVPVLIIHGIHDLIVPYSQGEQLHQLIPNSQLIPLIYSGHGGFWEEHDRVNQSILEWLGLVNEVNE